MIIIHNCITAYLFKHFSLSEIHLRHVHHTPNTVSQLHLVECSVDVAQRFPVRDEFVHHQLTAEVVVYQPGQLAAALDSTECASLPHTTGHQLERYTS